MKSFTKIIFSFFVIIAFSSCEKFLEKEPLNAVSDEAPITDRSSSETALRGVYRQLASSGYYGETYVTLGYFPSGDLKNLTTGGAANLVNVNFRSDEVLFNTAWAAIYNTINRANHVITKVPLVQDPLFSEDLKNQYIGEAKFIRALAYFDLARAWGGVQLFLKPTVSLTAASGIKRSTLDETYDQVLADLIAAEQLLPTGVNRIRATKNSVWALRARLHLYRKQWALAADYASRIIDLPADYTLVKPFKAWFADNATGTSESIFELQYSAINPSAIRSQMQHPTNGGTYRYAPTDQFVQLLNDPQVAGGRSSLISSVSQGGTKIWFGNVYYRANATDPAYVLRIAEMYLIRAEARAQLNQLPAALEDLNLIRRRADVPLSAAVTRAEVLLAIENERRLEFVFEAHRWFDLVRTGRAKTVLEALSPQTNVADHEWVFPIPIVQIQLDPNLQPNPNY